MTSVVGHLIFVTKFTDLLTKGRTQTTEHCRHAYEQPRSDGKYYVQILPDGRSDLAAHSMGLRGTNQHEARMHRQTVRRHG